MKTISQIPDERVTDTFLNKQQIGELTQLKLRTVDRLIAAGMPHYKIGSRVVRFKLEEVTQWMSKRYGCARIGSLKGAANHA